MENIRYNDILMARICGFLAGDGSVKVRKESNGKIHHSVEFYPDDESLIEPFVEAVEKVYNKKLTIETHRKHFRLRLYSKVVVEDLLKIANFGIYGWEIPEKILKKQEAQMEWLRAYFDSEAYVGKYYIKVQSVNRRGLKSVKKLLKTFEIYPKIYSYQPKKFGWNKVYILVINKKMDRINFLKRIGFNHKKKTDRLLSYLNHAEVA